MQKLKARHALLAFVVGAPVSFAAGYAGVEVARQLTKKIRKEISSNRLHKELGTRRTRFTSKNALRLRYPSGWRPNPRFAMPEHNVAIANVGAPKVFGSPDLLDGSVAWSLWRTQQAGQEQLLDAMNARPHRN